MGSDAARNSSKAPSIADLEADWFERCFVGREDALAALDEGLERAQRGPAVVWVHGVGGVGKTTLLGKWAGALRRGRSATRVVTLALGGVAGSPASFDAVLEAALLDADVRSIAALGREASPDALVLDGATSEGVLRWFFEARWSRVGVHTLLVVSSRTPPSASVRGLLSRVARLDTVPLGDLGEDEVRAFFARRDLAVPDLAGVRSVCGGLPLMLELAACRAREGEGEGALHVDDVVSGLDEVAPALLEGCVSEGREPVLELLAMVRRVDDALFEECLGAEAAADARRWLADVNFVAREPAGYRLHQVLREYVFRDLRRHAPERYRARLERVVDALLERLRGASIDRQCALLFEALHAGRGMGVLQQALPLPWFESLRVREVDASLSEPAALVVEAHEGAASAAYFRALAEAGVLRAHVLQELDGTVAAVLGSVDVAALRTAGLDAGDPLAAMTSRALGPGDCAGHVLVRWFFAARGYQDFGPALTAVMITNVATLGAQHPTGREAYFAVSDPERWNPLRAPMNITRIEGASAVLHGRTHGLDRAPMLRDDAGVVDCTANARSRIPLLVGLGPPSPPPEAPAPEARTSSPPAFDLEVLVAAVRDALQSLGRNDALARSPLAALAGPSSSLEETADRVRALLRQGMEQLTASEAYAPAVELLRVTYFEPGMKHEAAALHLNIPYGTYRYRHRRAIALLAQSLAAPGA